MKALPISLMATVLLLPVFSCRQEAGGEPSLHPVFRLGIDDLDGVDTKSLLTDGDIETKLSCVTLASYADGELLGCAYYAGGFDRMALDLPGRGQAHVYALANMGDLREALPASEADIGKLSYRIPGYTTAGSGLNQRGLPMAGMRTCQANETAPVIPVKRLLAKVTADLSVDWNGMISSVKVRNLNAVLHPFADSRAERAADLLAEEEFSVGPNTRTGSLVFYVPENLQGTVPSITSSSDKSRDNGALDSLNPVLSFLEVEVAAGAPYTGSMVYRSYLGANATSDFSIRRNCRYSWQIRYSQDGLSRQDWKHENRLSWTRDIFRLFSSEQTYFIGEELRVWGALRKDRYTGGVVDEVNWLWEAIPPSRIDWWKSDFDDPGFVDDRGFQSGGYWSFIAQYTGDGIIWGRYTDEWGSQESNAWLAVRGHTPTLTLSVSPTSIPLGGSVRFKAVFRHDELVQDVTSHFVHDPFTLDYQEYKLLDGEEGPYWGWDEYVSDLFIDIDAQGNYTPATTGTKTFRASYQYLQRQILSNQVTFSVAP